MTDSIKRLINLNQLITPEETARILGVTEGTLMIWRSTGRYDLPYVKVGRRVRYNITDVEAFIHKRTMLHTGKEKN